MNNVLLDQSPPPSLIKRIVKEVIAELESEDFSRKRVVRQKEAEKMLGISRHEFYALLRDEETLLRTNKGKYVVSSVKAEFERLFRVPYEKAV